MHESTAIIVRYCHTIVDEDQEIAQRPHSVGSYLVSITRRNDGDCVHSKDTRTQMC